MKTETRMETKGLSISIIKVPEPGRETETVTFALG